MNSLLSRRAPGQAIILVALCMVLIVCVLGLAIDGVQGFSERRKANNAVDIATQQATQALLTQKTNGGNGAAILTVIEATLNQQKIPATRTVSSKYFRGSDLSDGPVINATDTASDMNGYDGVRVSVNYTYQTSFIVLIGIFDLPVTASAASIYRPLGTALGGDVVPLGISQAAYNKLRDDQEWTLDLDKSLENAASDPINPVPMPTRTIRQVEMRSVSLLPFLPTSAPTGTGSCAADDPETLTATSQRRNFTYWWCHGSEDKIKIYYQLKDWTPDIGTLMGAIQWRYNNKQDASGRRIAVIPVTSQEILPDNSVGYNTNSFAVVELKNVNTSRRTIRVKLVRDFVSNGAVVGNGSGINTGIWAVNLVR